MASLREREPGVWEVRVFLGRNAKGRPMQISRVVRGGRRAAERVAAGLIVDEPSPAGGQTVAALLDVWQEHNFDRWTPSTISNQASRAALIAASPLGRLRVNSITVEDVDRWILDMRLAGVGRASTHNRLQVLRAAMTQAVRWGWISRNPASLATATGERASERAPMPDEIVAAAIAAASHVSVAMCKSPVVASESPTSVT